MFIQTEPTPNPATLKFLPGRPVLPHGTLEMRDKAAANQSPLAERLFEVEGVSGVFFGSDFISVTKAGGGEWHQLKPAILGAIMEHYMSGAPLLSDGSATSDEASDEAGEFFNEADAETVEMIKDLIETRVRPAVAISNVRTLSRYDRPSLARTVDAVVISGTRVRCVQPVHVFRGHRR